MKIKTLIVIITVLALGLLLTSCTSGGTAVNTWTGAAISDAVVYYAGGSQVYAMRDSGSNYTLTWTYPEKASGTRLFMAEPLIAGEQLILGDYGHLLTSVSTRDGAENWQFDDAKGRYIDTPLLEGDWIIAPNADNSVYALDLEGKLAWTFTKDGAFWAQPATDGKIVFVPSLNHWFYGINLNTGSQLWETDLLAPVSARPLYADGVVYVGNLVGDFFALNAANGKIIWTQKVGGGIWSKPILTDGKLYFGDQAGMVNIISAEDGKLILSVDAGSPVLGSGALLPDGIAFGTELGKIVLFDPEGKSRPLMTLESGNIYSNLVFNGERLVVLAYKSDKPLIALDLNGNEDWSFSTKK
jgi:outer membrane protein assembly factor BamB